MKHLGEGYLECQDGCGSWIVFISSEIRVCYIEIGIFYKRLKGGEGKNCFCIWEKNIEGRGNSKCKGSKARSGAQRPLWMA